MRTYLSKLAEGKTLSETEAGEALQIIMQGEAPPEAVAAFLMGLRTRGETIDELTGFTRTMRAFAVPVSLPDADAVDLCGTGGDASGTFNISTTAAFVVAGAGVTVAKHGNRSISSQSGSADVLRELGVAIDLDREGVESCLQEAGIAFLFAPRFHPAMRHVMPVRRALGVRTFFNILGPLCNPAGVRRQLVGAFSEAVARQMAEILARLGVARAITLHGAGLDEAALSRPTRAFLVEGGEVRPFTLVPEALGLERMPRETLRGGSAEANAAILRRVLSGARGPARDAVLLNAALALYTSGRFEDIPTALEAARESIDTGHALQKLHELVEISRTHAPNA